MKGLVSFVLLVSLAFASKSPEVTIEEPENFDEGLGKIRERRVTQGPDEDTVEETLQSPLSVDINGQSIINKPEKENPEKVINENLSELIDFENETITAGTGIFTQKLLHNKNGHNEHQGGYGAKPQNREYYIPELHQFHQHHIKPLKDSIVHRSPYDHYNKFDAIRTQDYDGKKHSLLHNLHHTSKEKHLLNLHHLHQNHNHHFKPYHYDLEKVPECAIKNRYYYNLTFCLEDFEYPEETILWAIKQYGDTHAILNNDVTYQSADNLVDGLTRHEEEGYTYKHYFGAEKFENDVHLDKYKPPYSGYSYNHDFIKKGGYVCPSNIYYARPKRAMNTYGKWKVIVNLEYLSKGHGHVHNILHSLLSLGHHHHPKAYTQTMRIEQCIYPNAPCSYIDSHVHSNCLQKHNFVRLVAWTYDLGLHTDTFKIPISCSCHIKEIKEIFTAHHHHLGHLDQLHHHQHHPQHHDHHPQLHPQHHDHHPQHHPHVETNHPQHETNDHPHSYVQIHHK